MYELSLILVGTLIGFVAAIVVYTATGGFDTDEFT
jgi:type III secretory pathway component EscT